MSVIFQFDSAIHCTLISPSLVLIFNIACAFIVVYVVKDTSNLLFFTFLLAKDKEQYEGNVLSFNCCLAKK